MSRIVTETAASILAIFAGQTIDQDALFAQIELSYAMANKRTGITSFFKVSDLVEAAGVSSRYTGPDYTGMCLYTFPELENAA